MPPSITSSITVEKVMRRKPDRGHRWPAV